MTIEQIATDFGVHLMTLQKWLRRVDIDEGAKPGPSRSESAEIRDLKKAEPAAGAGRRDPAVA